MMNLTFGLFTQVSGSGPLGPLVEIVKLFGAIHMVLGKILLNLSDL